MMQDPMHVCFCIPAMSGGGAERTVSILLAHFHSAGTRVSLLTYEAPTDASAYPLPDIPVIRLDLLGGRGLTRIRKVLARRRKIRHEIRRIDPDVVVSFMDTMNVAVLIALHGSGKPVVISERVDPAHHRLPGWKRLLRRVVYPKAQKLVVQTHRVARFFDWVESSRLIVIPNPIRPSERIAAPDRPGGDGRFRIVACGRLSPQKGFDDLIRAFAELRETFPLWELSIYGEGTERNKLEMLVDALGVVHRVTLPGWRADIQTVFASAHIMAFPSHYEGFPNALCEAAAAGLPLIGFAGVSGVEEIIVEGDNGILIGENDRVAGLRSALSTLMANAALRGKMGQHARMKMEAWRPERVAAMWQSVFMAITDPHRD